jgi:hypothetical protein
MEEKSKEELENSLKNVNKEIELLQKRLINSLNEVGIEYVNLYVFIEELNKLSRRKSRISYQLDKFI